MTIPAGYSMAPNGYYYYTDGSGPYTIDTSGNATLVGSGTGSGGSTGGGGSDPVPDPEVAKISKLVSGGGVAHISGLTFRVSAATYYIQGVLYSSPQTDITLDAADGTNPRIDVFALTTSSTAVDVTGTPATPAAKPEVAPDTQLEVSFAYIAAAATEPTGYTATESIYAEATEWTRATNGNVTSNSASSPINGTVSILFANAAVGAYIRLTDSADLDLADSSNLVFTIKNAAAWPALSRLNIGWYTNGGALRGQLVSFKPGDYGSSSSSTDAQQIVIPLSAFGANGLAVRRLQMTLAGATVTTQFRLDDISLQAVTGIVVDDSKLHWEGTWNANRLYSLNSVVKTATSTYVAIRANTNADPATATSDWTAMVPAAAGGGTKTYAVLTPMTSQPPAANFATLDTRNSIAVLDFDASTDESIFWVFIMPEAASLGSGLKIRIHWMATSATSGACRWGAQLEKMDVTDEDSDSFDTAATAGTTTSGTSGIVNVTEITITTIDSIVAGSPYRLKVYRDADGTSGTDDMTGDAELVAVELRSAA